MKILLLVGLMTFSAVTYAGTVKSSEAKISADRVVSVTNLLNKGGGNGKNLVVNVVVKDLGGSTDMSPTQTVYLTMYSKGEMFSTGASFEIADIFELKSAKRASAGVYEINAMTVTDEGEYKQITYVIDGKKASKAIQDVDCGDDFDCDASKNFSSDVEVTVK